jgi:hypothetical protein
MGMRPNYVRSRIAQPGDPLGIRCRQRRNANFKSGTECNSTEILAGVVDRDTIKGSFDSGRWRIPYSHRRCEIPHHKIENRKREENKEGDVGNISRARKCSWATLNRLDEGSKVRACRRYAYQRSDHGTGEKKIQNLHDGVDDFQVVPGLVVSHRNECCDDCTD